ncbi:MAG TPA: hypothetical protein VGA02_05700 [Gemmatimonadales bacterium]|jgi:Tol biopolymer transport system component
MTRNTGTITVAFGLTLALAACDASQRQVVLGGAIDLSATTLDSAESATLRRVWARAGDYATPSPDGRSIAFVDWSTGDVAVHDLASGEDRRLTNKGTWTENGSWAEEPLFSPDGRHVAYSYGNVRVPNANFQYELRVVAVNDTTPRVLVALSPRDMWINPTDWSASQGILAEIFRRDANERATEDLAIVHPASGATRVLRTVRRGDGTMHDGAFSPDGRYVAYRQGKDVRVIGSDGSGDRSLDIEVRWVLGWSRDGGSVLVHASSQSTTGIWSVPVSRGRRAGEPQLVRGGMPAFMPGGFAGSSYFYLVPVDAPKVFIASLDVLAGRVLAPPVAITSPVQGRGGAPAWSPDGRTLAYYVRDASERTTRIMLRDADGDAVRELAAIPQRQVEGMFWAPDGQTLYVRDGNGAAATILRVDVRTGEVGEAYAYHGSGVTFTPDGRLVYARSAPERPDVPSGVFVRDLATDREQRIADERAVTRSLGVSPDGRHLALVLRRDADRVSKVVVMSIDGGPMREIAREAHPMHFEDNDFGSVNWTPDGRHVLVMRGSWEGDSTHAMVAIPVGGGAITQVMRANGQRTHVLHPDGRRIAYSGGAHRDELWVLDDLAPQGGR